MISRSGFSEGQSARQLNSTFGKSVAGFHRSPCSAKCRRAGGLVKKLINGSALARLQKLLQRLIPYLTGFFPGAKLTARLFHGKANSFAVNFPGVSFWQWGGDASLHPKISIEVCLYHTHATTLYGDGAPEHHIDLRLSAFLSNIAHTYATLCTLSFVKRSKEPSNAEVSACRDRRGTRKPI
jgi:hypothetical protein